MDTLMMIVGGHTQVLIERALDRYPIEDWDYFISGLNTYFGDDEESDQEWLKFVEENNILHRLLASILRKCESKINDFMDRRILDLVGDGFNRHQVIFDITILPDPTTDLYLLTVKSNIVADNSFDVDFMLLN